MNAQQGTVSMAAKGRMAWLDLFRGLAAIVVVAFHFYYGLHIPQVKFGPLAVDLFFVLSGIVLGRKYDAEILAGLTFGEFAWHRLRRLYPMVLIATAFILAVNACGIPPLPWSFSSWSAIAGLLSVTTFAADPPVWSLQAELAANVVWFLALRSSRIATYAMFGLSLIGFVVLAFVDGGIVTSVAHAGIEHYGRALLRALAWFGVGYAISMRRPNPSVPTWLLLSALVGTCVLVQFGLLRGAVGDLSIVASGTLLLTRLMHVQPASPTVARICTWFGMLSFPLYMTHMPASRIASWAVTHGVRVLIAYLLTFVAVGVLATVLNEWIIRKLPAEWPGSRRARARRESIAP
jgi:peptidoglycan/LPS O-acetylase OafA/YrhL